MSWSFRTIYTLATTVGLSAVVAVSEFQQRAGHPPLGAPMPHRYC